jgi:conjugal transfer pilus assembly protein TraD
MKTKPQQGPGYDAFTPIFEIFHELCLLVVDFLLFLMKWVFRKMSGRPLEVRILKKDALKVRKVTVDEESLGIDTATKQPIKLGDIDFRRHSFIVGGSGFGKTNLMTILQENSLKMNRPVIFIDPKGDLETLNGFRSLCRMHQRPCYVFSEYHPDTIELNPLLEGTVNQITSRIMNTYNSSNEFYQTQCENAVLVACKKIHSRGDAIKLQSILSELKLIQTEHNSGIIAHLNRIQESDFAKILNGGSDSLTLSKIREERACLYIGLSVQGYGETARTIGKLFLGELLHNSYMTMRISSHGEGLQNPITVHFDELGSLLVPDFIELLNKCRGAGIELTMAVQTPADLAKFDENLPTQIIENSGNLFILKQRVDSSAALFSQAIGTILSTKSTHVVEDGEKQSRGSEREVYELLAHPDIIKNLGIGQCILLRQAPTQLNLINVRDRKMSLIKKHNQAKRMGGKRD